MRELTSIGEQNGQQFQHQDKGGDSGVSTIARATTKPKAHCNRRKATLILLFAVGLIVFVGSLLSLLLLPSLVANQIAKRLVLKNNSLLLDRWAKPNVPMLFKVWLFDVVNAQALLTNRKERVKVREVGPFVFRMRRVKDIVSITHDTLYYTEKKTYHFSPQESCCDINSTVTVPNIPLVSIVERATSVQVPLVGRLVPRLVNRAVQTLRELPFVRRQVRELLFDGYDVELLKMVSLIGSLVGVNQPAGGGQKFGLFRGRNDTWRPDADGVWAINTGASNRGSFGKVMSWNAQRSLSFWPSPECNAINGSDGTIFAPPVSPGEQLYIFNPELCRTVRMSYAGKSDVRGIASLRFTLNADNFARTVAGSSSGSGHLSDSAQIGNRRRRPLSVRRQPNRRQATTTPATATIPTTITTPTTTTTTPTANTSSATSSSLEPELLLRQEPTTALNKMSCFCDRKSVDLNGVNICSFDGLIDMSRCTKHASVVFGSAPHFAGNDARLQRLVAGLAPNASRHTTYLDVEPLSAHRADNNNSSSSHWQLSIAQLLVFFNIRATFLRGNDFTTGLVLAGKRRIQLNLAMRRTPDVDGFENISDMLVPILWLEESAMMPEESAQKFRTMYTNRVRNINIVLLSLLIGSVALLVLDVSLLRLHFNSTGFRGGKRRNSAALNVAASQAFVVAAPKRNNMEPSQTLAPHASKIRELTTLGSMHITITAPDSARNSSSPLLGSTTPVGSNSTGGSGTSSPSDLSSPSSSSRRSANSRRREEEVGDATSVVRVVATRKR